MEPFFREAELTMVYVILKNKQTNQNILNESSIFMSSKSLKPKYRMNTNYITYIAYVHAVKSYICKTGLSVVGNGSADMIKDL